LRTMSRSAGLYLYMVSAFFVCHSLETVPQQLLDEVDVSHQHTTTAVSREAEFVHGFAARQSIVYSSFHVLIARTRP